MKKYLKLLSTKVHVLVIRESKRAAILALEILAVFDRTFQHGAKDMYFISLFKKYYRNLFYSDPETTVKSRPGHYAAKYGPLAASDRPV